MKFYASNPSAYWQADGERVTWHDADYPLGQPMSHWTGEDLAEVCKAGHPSDRELTPAEVQTIRDGWGKSSPTPDAREGAVAKLVEAVGLVFDRDLTYFGDMVFESITRAEVDTIRKALSAYKHLNP